jgi:uncharacterized protein (DUF1015 family)
MAKLAPFRALRYDAAKVKDLGKVVAPPYDIIAPKEQDFYYNLHPHNVIRLDFGKAQGGDDAKRNKYSRAATLLRLWREQGVLKQDLKPGLYVASQTYKAPNGRTGTFVGVYAELKLEQYKSGIVRPHEKTLSKPKADRLELTKATQANFSPIFFLYDDKKGATLKWMAAQMKKKPSVSFRTPNGEQGKLWIVDAPAAIKGFTGKLGKSPVYIADGHHRYETMLRYAKEAPKAVKKAAQGTLACLTPFQNKSLLILPTHRLVHGLKGFSGPRLLQALTGDFNVKAEASLSAAEKAVARAKGFAFVLALPEGAYSAALKPAVKPEQAVKERRSKAYKGLDVSLLQALVLEKVLGMTPESIAAQEGLFFEKSADKAAKSVAAGEAQAAFIIRATRMEQLKAVSDAKDVMPQKSTYFLPKLITGAVLRAMS